MDKTEDKTILCDENHHFHIKDSNEEIEMEFSAVFNLKTPRQLLTNPNANIAFLKAMDYDDILQKFREFKANMK